LLDFAAAKWYFARQSTAKGTEIFLRKACVFDSLTATRLTAKQQMRKGSCEKEGGQVRSSGFSA